MNTTDRPRFVTIDDPQLSVWQSAVAFHVRRTLVAQGKPSHTAAVRAHPMMQAVTDHVLAEKKGRSIAAPTAAEKAASPYTAHGSKKAFLHAFPARAEAAAEAEPDSGWDPADSNVGPWLEVFKDNSILLIDGKTPQYIDCNGNMGFGVIPWTLPDDATVIVLGDWGSGNEDAIALLANAIGKAGSRLGAVIHLGDVYYSGQPSECTDNIANAVTAAFQAAGVAAVPMFWIPGNHEYYSMGQGFYATFPEMNAGNAQATQAASFFCLRTASGGYQFLGMDTGQSDDVAADGPFGSSTIQLRPSEIAWHQDKLANFGGSTILLSHHQLFSATTKVTAGNDTPWINGSLWSAFSPYFESVSLWMWGHEHNQQLFYPGMFGLAMGRLLGASAYEEAADDSGLAAQNALVQVPAIPGLTPANGYYNHGYAVIDLAGSGAGATVAYYAFPSWDQGYAPESPTGTLLATDTLATPAQMGPSAWPPAANLLRYIPQGMAPGHACRLSVSPDGSTGSWTVLDDGGQLVQAAGAGGLTFKGSIAGTYSLTIQLGQPTAGASSTCPLAIGFSPAKGTSVNLESSAAAIVETTSLEPGGTGVISSFGLTANGWTVAVSSFPNDTPNIEWDPHVLFVIQGPGGEPLVYLAIEDKTLG